ncbi:DNA helicase UvrD [Pseudomonas citronellolis]|nr:DNA helicase UvrD [Pseudomonas citronellolis]
MGKEVMFAVAGSGKTSTIIGRLSLEQRALIVTYTDNNHRHLQQSIIRKFGHVPPNITVLTYFVFLYRFCYRPLLELQLDTRGLNFRLPPAYTQMIPRQNMEYYEDGQGNLFHNRLAKLLQIKDVVPRVIARIERFYDQFFVDEVQDFAGHDFDLLLALIPVRTDILLVGDFYQHTFDTSRDGNTNSTLHNDIHRYEQRFARAGVTVDKQTLSRSWRCDATVCDFIRGHLQIDIHSHRNEATGIIPVGSQAEANALHADPNIVKLFYKEHYKYGCHSYNWGGSKGMDHFQDVCVILSAQNWKLYQQGSFAGLAAQTRNKLYVACSRARGNLYLAHDKYFKSFKTL